MEYEAATFLRLVRGWPSREATAHQLRIARRSGRAYERLVPFEVIHEAATRMEEVRNELEALLPVARAEAHPDQRPEGYKATPVD